jgi:predicted phage terminase large subunit-like protein
MRRTKVNQDLISSPLEAAIQAELVRRDREILPHSFHEFIRAAWAEIDDSPFCDNWHLDAICEHLEACAKREIRNLVINIPPRLGKSTLGAVLFPAWILARNPSETLLFSSYSSSLAIRDSVKCRALVESDWFQARFPHVVIRDDSNLKTSWLTTAKGGRQTTSVGGTVTGMGGSILVVDDPLNASEAESAAEREKANTWFSETWSNRIAGDPAQAVSIVIMQRLHANDVSHLCINKMGYERLVLPMEYEGDKHVTKIGWRDPRTEIGDLMWPQRWSKEVVLEQKLKSGEYAWAGQYQQRPAPRGGGIIKDKWLRFWYDPSISEPEPVSVPDGNGSFIECAQVELYAAGPKRIPSLMSIDAAFKGTATSDYTVCQIWSRLNDGYYLLDQVREKLDFVQTMKAIHDLNDKWRPLPTLIEDKANGSAIISALRGDVQGVIPVNPQGGKKSRLSAVSPLIEGGHVYLPHPDQFPWAREVIRELTVFPNAQHDDTVDALSQALTHMRERPSVIVDMDFVTGGEYRSALIEDSYWEGI